MHLDSFIMRAVWLIFALWCPPNVQEHGQNTNVLFLLHTFYRLCSPSTWSSANDLSLKKDELVTMWHERQRISMKRACEKTCWKLVKRTHANICQFAQCKQAVTICTRVSRSNPWITHQLARGYCSTLAVKAGERVWAWVCVTVGRCGEGARGDYN